MNRATPQKQKGKKLSNPKLLKIAKRTKVTKKQPKKVFTQSKRFNTAAPTSIHFSAEAPQYELSPKESTMIAGLPAVPNGRDVLESLYLHTIDLARDYTRKTGHFLYKSVENTTTYRLAVLRKYPQDDLMVQRVIGAGQIEELIEQAEGELTLLDAFQQHREYEISDDILKASAPAFGSLNPRVETRIFPLPDEILQEVATGKFTINPFHPTKPVSRKLIQHVGLGDSITAEEHAKYDEMLVLTDKDKAVQAKNLSVDIHKIISQDIEDSLLINKKEPLSQEYFDFFESSTIVHPELNTEVVKQMTEAYELHVRKL